MAEYNVGDKVRITYDNGSVLEGLVQKTTQSGQPYVSYGGFAVYWEPEESAGDRRVELIEKARPKLPTKAGSRIRFTRGGHEWCLDRHGDWRAVPSGSLKGDGVEWRAEWEEVVVVPKAALDKLRSKPNSYDHSVPNSVVRDFFKYVDGEK